MADLPLWATTFAIDPRSYRTASPLGLPVIHLVNDWNNATTLHLCHSNVLYLLRVILAGCSFTLISSLKYLFPICAPTLDLYHFGKLSFFDCPRARTSGPQ